MRRCMAVYTSNNLYKNVIEQQHFNLGIVPEETHTFTNIMLYGRTLTRDRELPRLVTNAECLKKA